MKIKIAFIGAGSLGFTRRLIIDLLSYPELHNCVISLMDVDPVRLGYMKRVAERIVAEGKYSKIKIEATRDRKKALTGADFVFITILTGGSEPIKKDIIIPMKYGIDQAIGDSMSIGGVMRAQRTIPVMLGIAEDVGRFSAKDALILNYTNPMSMLCWAVYKTSDVKMVGLCHSVQGTSEMLARFLGVPIEEIACWVAGINHQAWFLEYKRRGKDLLPLIRKVVERPDVYREEPVRCEMCRQLGYFVTESSPHNSEYNAWFRKRKDLINKYLLQDTHGMLVTEYTERRDDWQKWMEGVASGKDPLDLSRSHEYGAGIVYAVVTGIPFRFNGNVRNSGLITNLPQDACVEVPCLADRRGISPLFVGALPPHLAALNKMNISVQELGMKAALERDPELIFQAAALDPLVSSVLSLQETRNMVCELMNASRKWLPRYKGRIDKKGEIKGIVVATAKVSAKNKDKFFKETNAITGYYIIGPFDNKTPENKFAGLNIAYPPEEKVDLQAVYSGKGNRKIRWRKIGMKDMFSDGFVGLRHLLGTVDLAVGYAWVQMEAMTECCLKLLTGSDDGIAVWLNHKRVFSIDAVRCAQRDQNAVDLFLKHGYNELLFKISQKYGGWGFYARFKKLPKGVSLRV